MYLSYLTHYFSICFFLRFKEICICDAIFQSIITIIIENQFVYFFFPLQNSKQEELRNKVI